MNELLKINYETEQPTVSARELYMGLEIKSKYADWFKSMSAYGFVENIDYFTVSKNLENGGRVIEHEISVDMAKQICMLQRSEKGKLYRQYFIDMEKAWNSPEQIFARALKMANQKIESLKQDNAALLEDNERMKPKEVFADAVTASHTSILIGDLAKLLRQNGVNTGQKRLFEQLRADGYLVKRKGSDWNMPTQKAVNMGILEVKETVITNLDGSTRITRTPKVTGKGQQYFVNRYLKNIDQDFTR